MDAFLRQAAAHYIKNGKIAGSVFIFPNRRSMVFFKKYLGEFVTDEPILSPPMFTINDFFYKVYGSRPLDRLRLMTELYACYKELNPVAEPLDEFIFWGDVMLGDFDDTDKYLVSPRELFLNIAQFKDIKEDFSYLTSSQKEAIEAFLSHFRDAGGIDKESVKGRFLHIWNLLYPLYEAFNTRLRSKGQAYEGMVYRDLARRLQGGASVKDILAPLFPEAARFVFIGLNALNECERTVMKKMRDAALAEFVWDYVTPQIRDRANKSSFFMQRNVEDFPQAFPIYAGGVPQVEVISVPSGVAQAKLAPELLQGTTEDPVETAIVLPDENLLLPLLNSLPPEVESVNVTMGYPMTGSGVYSLVMALGQLQLRVRRKDGLLYFYHRNVSEVFSSSLFINMLSESEKVKVEDVRKAAKYYIPTEDLSGGPVLDLVFREIPADAASLGRYLYDFCGALGRSLSRQEDMLLEIDFAKRLHTQLTILLEAGLDIAPATWLRVLGNVLKGISVPFKGEPLKGVQIMGPLETRALDFSNLIILSANEGVFPRRSVSSSFIPPELRRGFGLPTYEFQDAVWAYYFYRLLQRAQKVWMLYDSRTEGLHSGEESRYIKQLEYHYGLHIRRRVATAVLKPLDPDRDIEKTPQEMEILKGRYLSATALQSYLQCQAKFYYKVVKRLDRKEDVAESLDAGMTGNVFHHVMHRLYSGRKTIGREYLKSLLGARDDIAAIVREEILREMNSIEVSGRNLVIEEVIKDYVGSALRRDLSLLDAPGSKGEFTIYGLEQEMKMSFAGFNIIGYIDRLDSYRDSEIRIVDYKTGKVEDEDILIDDSNALKVADKLFGPNNYGRPKIALQLFLYRELVRGKFKGRLVNSIYNTSGFYTGAFPDVPESMVFSSEVRERLELMLGEIADLKQPFTHTQDRNTCEFCDFKTICGR